MSFADCIVCFSVFSGLDYTMRMEGGEGGKGPPHEKADQSLNKFCNSMTL